MTALFQCGGETFGGNFVEKSEGDPLKGTAVQGTGVQPSPEVFPFSVFLETTLF